MSIQELSDLFSPLFAQLSSVESWKILALLFGAFLIGWIFGNLRWRGKYKRLKKAFKQQEAEVITLTANLESTQQKLAQHTTELEEAQQAAEEMRSTIQQLEKDKGQLNGDLYALKDQQEQMQARNEEYATQIETLQTSSNEYTSQVEQLRHELTEAREQARQTEESNTKYAVELAALQTQNSDYLRQIAQLQQAIEDRPATTIEFVEEEEIDLDVEEIDLPPIPNPTLDRLAAIEERLALIAQENQDLRSRLKQNNTNAPVSNVKTYDEIEEEEDSENTTGQAAKKALAKAYGSRLPVAKAIDRDDLKLLNGIGPFLEEKLNEVGIYTYDQISLLDDELIEWVTAAIQFFPGRIKRDDWVGQASALMSS